MCVIIYNELQKLLCDKLGQPGWLQYLLVLHSPTPSGSETQGQRDCSIKSISIKALFHPMCSRMLFFLFHLVKLQGTGLGLPFYVPDYMPAKQWPGGLWGELLNFSPWRCFSYVEPLPSRGIWNPSVEKKQLEQPRPQTKGCEREGGKFRSWERRDGWRKTLLQLQSARGRGKGGRKGWLCCQGCRTTFGRQHVRIYYR